MRTARTIKRENSERKLYLVDDKRVTQPKRKKRKFPRIYKIIVAGLGLYLLFVFGTVGFEIWQLKKQVQKLEQEQNIIAQQQAQLQQEIEALDDPEVIEKLAREGLGMVHPGESIVIPAVPGNDIPKPKNIAPSEITH